MPDLPADRVVPDMDNASIRSPTREIYDRYITCTDRTTTVDSAILVHLGLQGAASEVWRSLVIHLQTFFDTMIDTHPTEAQKSDFGLPPNYGASLIPELKIESVVYFNRLIQGDGPDGNESSVARHSRDNPTQMCNDIDFEDAAESRVSIDFGEAGMLVISCLSREDKASSLAGRQGGE